MSILAHLLREYQEQYDDMDQESNDFQDAEREEVDQQPAPVEDKRKIHKIKQTFSVDQGSTKLDTTVLVRVVADDEADAKRIADQQLAKLAAYMRDVDLNDREEVTDRRGRDFSNIRERAGKLWNR